MMRIATRTTTTTAAPTISEMNIGSNASARAGCTSIPASAASSTTQTHFLKVTRSSLSLVPRPRLGWRALGGSTSDVTPRFDVRTALIVSRLSRTLVSLRDWNRGRGRGVQTRGMGDRLPRPRRDLDPRLGARLHARVVRFGARAVVPVGLWRSRWLDVHG